MVLDSPLSWDSAKGHNLQEAPLRLRPVYTFALFASVTCMSVASWIRFLNGWSYEDAGLWLNMAFWGSGAATLGFFAMHSWAFLCDMEVLQDYASQIEKEKALRKELNPTTVSSPEGAHLRPSNE